MSWTHTMGGGINGALYVVVMSGTIGGITGSVAVTYNGVALTQIATLSSGAYQVWRLLNPPSGAHTVQVSWTGGGSAFCSATSFFGVDQTTPEGTIVTDNTGMPTTVSDTATYPTNGMLFDHAGAVFSGGHLSLTVDASQTLSKNWSSGNYYGGTSYRASSGAMTWTLGQTPTSYGHIVVPINPVGGWRGGLTAVGCGS